MKRPASYVLVPCLLVRRRRLQLARGGQRILGRYSTRHRQDERHDEAGTRTYEAGAFHFFLISTLSFAGVVAVTVTKCLCSPRSGCLNTTS